MSNFIVPVKSGASFAKQNFPVSLSGKLLDFRLTYQTLLSAWSLDVYDKKRAVLLGAMLRANTDAFRTTKELRELGKLLVVGDEPTLDNVGTSSELVFVSAA